MSIFDRLAGMTENLIYHLAGTTKESAGQLNSDMDRWVTYHGMTRIESDSRTAREIKAEVQKDLSARCVQIQSGTSYKLDSVLDLHIFPFEKAQHIWKKVCVASIAVGAISGLAGLGIIWFCPWRQLARTSPWKACAAGAAVVVAVSETFIACIIRSEAVSHRTSLPKPCNWMSAYVQPIAEFRKGVIENGLKQIGTFHAKLRDNFPNRDWDTMFFSQEEGKMLEAEWLQSIKDEYGHQDRAVFGKMVVEGKLFPSSQSVFFRRLHEHVERFLKAVSDRQPPYSRFKDEFQSWQKKHLSALDPAFLEILDRRWLAAVEKNTVVIDERYYRTVGSIFWDMLEPWMLSGFYHTTLLREFEETYGPGGVDESDVWRFTESADIATARQEYAKISDEGLRERLLGFLKRDE